MDIYLIGMVLIKPFCFLYVKNNKSDQNINKLKDFSSTLHQKNKTLQFH